MAINYQLGQEAILYYGAAGTTAATAFGLVKTANWGIERNAVEGNYRDSIYTNTRSGQAKLPTGFTCRRKTADTTYQALKAAVKAAVNNVVALKFISVSGGTDEVIDADFAILKFNADENMDEFQEIKVECALNTDTRAPTIT
jgi:hypothetical protein